MRCQINLPGLLSCRVDMYKAMIATYSMIERTTSIRIAVVSRQYCWPKRQCMCTKLHCTHRRMTIQCCCRIQLDKRFVALNRAPAAWDESDRTIQKTCPPCVAERRPSPGVNNPKKTSTSTCCGRLISMWKSAIKDARAAA